MSATSELLPPPNSPDAFESLCLDLWREIWGDPSAQKNGRSGQAQAGVDVFGEQDGRQVGVQCKQRGGLLHSKLSLKELEVEVGLAGKFEPQLQTFVLATSGPRDARLQKRARELSQSGDFKVEVWSWDDIWHELYQRPKLLARIKPVYWPLLSALGEPKIGAPHLPRFAARLFGRDREHEQLEEAWLGETVRVLTIVAWGGTGKTSLVAHWADRLAQRRYDGADYFEWSFYSQGTRDQTTASADIFLDKALRHFGDEKMADSVSSSRDKGERLAALLGTRRALLLLDGLEPLQHPPGQLAGELKDAGMVGLLRGLAVKNAGLCVVTTRESVKDLERWRGGTAPEWLLSHLSVPAGLELLRSLGVLGPQVELKQLVNDVKGHALTLNLLGTFLRDAYDGDVRKRDMVHLEEADAEIQGGHAFRVMAAYEGWFEAEGEQGRRQLAALRLLGLFDRPASAECLAALRKGPAIAGLTESLMGQSEVSWKLTLKHLVEAGLVELGENSVDSHPLIREYFASRLKGEDAKGLGLDVGAAAWREAHGRLFDFLKENTEHRPDTLAGLQPLYQAVYHGCQAGRQQEACGDVYFYRILRGSEAFVVHMLGAFGIDLGAAACFFELPWSRVSPSITEAYQAWLLNEAAFRLRALGRLREAVEPMRAGLGGAASLGDWDNAARYASNLSELELTLGEVQAAVADAEQSVAFADRSGDVFLQILNRTTLADARSKAGEEGAALALYREAEGLQAELQPQCPLLYSLQGFRYCDMMLATAERAAGSGLDGDSEGIAACAEVERWAAMTLSIAVRNSWTLDIALDHLSLGRSRLYRAILESRGSAMAAEAHIDLEEAVVGLRASGRSDFVPFGLLTRAWLCFTCDDMEGARTDLDEAEEIAERGSMRLFQADVALYRARFFGDAGALAEARRLVTECGYLRRMPEIEDLEARRA